MWANSLALCLLNSILYHYYCYTHIKYLQKQLILPKSSGLQAFLVIYNYSEKTELVDPILNIYGYMHTSRHIMHTHWYVLKCAVFVVKPPLKINFKIWEMNETTNIYVFISLCNSNLMLAFWLKLKTLFIVIFSAKALRLNMLHISESSCCDRTIVKSGIEFSSFLSSVSWLF